MDEEFLSDELVDSFTKSFSVEIFDKYKSNLDFDLDDLSVNDEEDEEENDTEIENTCDLELSGIEISGAKKKI